MRSQVCVCQTAACLTVSVRSFPCCSFPSLLPDPDFTLVGETMNEGTALKISSGRTGRDGVAGLLFVRPKPLVTSRASQVSMLGLGRWAAGAASAGQLA